MTNGARGDCNRRLARYAWESPIRHDRREGDDMTNPLTSLTTTVIMGVALTVIMVAILAAIS